MSSGNENLLLGSNDHANNFAVRFMELLHERELVDVILVADGQTFPAHRLILSALSPYFRKMFKQMAINQQAYVFMPDISKQTLEDLIKYMYNGEVELNPESLEDFRKKAKSLEIDGICDDSYWQTSDQQQPNHLARNVTEPSHRAIQFQASHVNRFYNLHVASDRISSALTFTNNSGYDDSNASAYEVVSVDSYGYDSNFHSDNNYDDSMDQCFDQYAEWDQTYNDHDDNDDDDDDDDDGNKANAYVATTTKRVKRTNANNNNDTSEYDIFADIQDKNGRENVFYNNNMFGKNGKPNGKGQQRWRCSKINRKCRAALSTIDKNGVMMLKVLIAEHSHEP